MPKLTYFVLLLTAGLSLATGTRAATPRSEIDALLARLETSGCEFNRNGTWHSGHEAKGHLLRKLEYLENKHLASSAEQFIDRGASSSSSSGKAYLVRCPGQAPLPSQQWLTQELQKLRATPAPSATSRNTP